MSVSRVREKRMAGAGNGASQATAPVPDPTEVGSQWTDTGKVHEERDLKGRAEGDTRLVLIHPSLVVLLREIIKEYDLKPADLLFPGEKGGMLAGSVFRRVWAKARKEILSEHEFKSPTGKRVYDLRHPA